MKKNTLQNVLDKLAEELEPLIKGAHQCSSLLGVMAHNPVGCPWQKYMAKSGCLQGRRRNLISGGTSLQTYYDILIWPPRYVWRENNEGALIRGLGHAMKK